MNITIGLLNNLVKHQLKNKKDITVFESVKEDKIEYLSITDKELLYLQEMRIQYLESILNSFGVFIDVNKTLFELDGTKANSNYDLVNVVSLEEYVSRRNQTSK